jgi:hypothetical protein
MKGSEIRPGLYPEPPNLSQVRAEPQDAFWIIKHGTKMSAMPACGLSHDDPTICSMVAFLQILPNMTHVRQIDDVASAIRHSHVFLGTGHEQNEGKTCGVIVLCGTMMIVEIAGGSLFGSLALIADGLHMSTHVGAMLIIALAYTYARRHAADGRFVFGTGKRGYDAGDRVRTRIGACDYDVRARFW